MRAGGGKQKGAQYERATCSRLSLWVSEMKRQDVFWRSAMSGGRANLRSRRRREGEFSAQAGDITATHALGDLLIRLFCVDAKNYKDFEFEKLAFCSTAEVGKAWIKTQEEAARFGKIPLMVLKQNNKDDVVCTDRRGRQILRDGLIPGKSLRTNIIVPPLGMYVLDLRQMLLRVDFKLIRKKYKDHKPRIKRVRM